VPRRKKAPAGHARSRLRVVCVISANPLALAELERLVRRERGVRVKSALLDLTPGLNSRQLRVPRASAYVLDSWSTATATEAVIAAMRARPNVKLILLTGGLSDAASFAFLRLGVKGLIGQKQIADQLPRAVVAVASGGLWIPRALLSKFVAHTVAPRAPERGPSTPRISQRERQVLDCVLRSLSNKEISAELHISESTVKFHVARLFEKFGVRRRADLILQRVQQSAAVVH
jgi:DNA-binding NarL/FixJ family response regulator